MGKVYGLADVGHLLYFRPGDYSQLPRTTDKTGWRRLRPDMGDEVGSERYVLESQITERKVLNGMIEHGNDFIYGTDHIGAKFINTVPFRDLPETTDAVHWVEIEGGNHEKFGPYRMYQLEVKDWSKVPQEPIREYPGWIASNYTTISEWEKAHRYPKTPADHSNWLRPMREISPHLAHLYPVGLTLGEHKFHGLDGEVNKLAIEVAALKKSNKWFIAKVIGLIVIYNATKIIIDGAWDYFGW